MTAKTRIVRIGNSRGIRIPKTLLEEAELGDEVELHAEPGRLVIEGVRHAGRGGPRSRNACAAVAMTSSLTSPRPPSSMVRSGSGGRADLDWSRARLPGSAPTHPGAPHT